MYESFFGLTARPFDLTPNPAYLVPLDQHREAVSALGHALGTGKGLVVLTGEVGTGKTTVLRAALATTGPEDHVVTLENPSLTRAEFLESLALSFDLSGRAAASKAYLLRELADRLTALRAEGRRCALVVDEAQCLTTALLEEVRLLGNLETETEKLLPMVLVGQPELRDRLNGPDLRQLKQRVALRCELRPLTFSETVTYIAARVRQAGSDRNLFTREALRLIHQRSAGIPRSINVICDNALIAALAAGAPVAGEAHVREVCRDLDLGGTPVSVSDPSGDESGSPAPGMDRSSTLLGHAGRSSSDDNRAAATRAEEDRAPAAMFAPGRRLWLFR